MRAARYGFLVLAGCVIAALCRGNEPAGSGRARGATPIAASEFRGAGSCSAVACHGSIKEVKSPLSSVRRNEHTTWMSSDKHSRAYAVLFDGRSDLIERRLAGSESEYPKASEDARCLACHTTPRPAAELGQTAWLNSDGVGCESCHGAAASYLGPHTTWEWKHKTREQKAGKPWSLQNTKDLKVRAEICAGCHVGERSAGADGLAVRDVNHDLIAAGHPRLNFELSAYLENMPPHWDEKDENAGEAGSSGRAVNFGARAWSIGRLTTIKAALALLGGRLADVEQRPAAAEAPPEPLPGVGATNNKRAAPWPEFSEYGCFSCHHDLRDQVWRRTLRGKDVAAGSLRWGTWILPGTEALFSSPAVRPENRTATEGLHRLAVLMEKPGALAQIKLAVRDASKSIDDCLDDVAKHTFDVKTIEGLIEQIDDQKAWDRVASWDEAAQRYLALVSLYHSWLASQPARTPKQEALRQRLDELLKRLEFPKGFNSPRGFEPGLFPSRGR
jgi:Cytochrome c554 and c-prime